MQMDLHHTGMYVLCRITGMKSEYAEIAAYASQQVDDATYGHALKFENGGAFRQTRTSEKLLSSKNLDVNEALETWLPFHFLPNNLDIENAESQICRTNSKVLKLLLENIRESAASPIGLYRLGIGLHCFADTYTHQDFKGFFDQYNMVTLLSGIEEKDKIKKQIDDTVERILNNHFPILAVGHGEVLSNPDIPYVKWSYSRGTDIYVIENLRERFIVALEDIYSFLTEFVKSTPYVQSGIEPKPFDFYKEKFFYVLQYKGNAKERHANWLELIRNNYFEFEDHDEIDRNLDYDPRLWFRNAVDVIKIPLWRKYLSQMINNCDFYRTRPGFHTSHWAKYMHAAAEHQFTVLHKILPVDTVYFYLQPVCK
ncbi:MAG: hypothetical protein AWM53_00281 [Candidatus Dichloromethanomonas elyunquensis]|nr:MAG: hypothetical protein AWM53_00281 [Candidatus Dichloromethanomonas elyunquensis]